jgi:hypothetical protein
MKRQAGRLRIGLKGILALNPGKKIIACLKARFEEKFAARQIAGWVFATFPAECQAKKEKARISPAMQN